jgi:uncharacterized protein
VSTADPNPKPWRITRRRFLASVGGAAALGVGFGTYACGVEPHWVEVVRRDMPLPGLPPALEGRTVVQLSDLHVGPVVSSDYLVASLQKAAALQPDLVAVTGDFMSCRGAEQVDAVARVMEHLPKAPLGCFAVLGNHDYAQGWSNPEVAEQLCKRLTDLGVQVLRNSSRSVEGLQLVGLDDLWSPCFRPAEVMPGLDRNRPSLCLCHNPDAADLPIWSQFRGWILSGHTHGGQVKPPFLPPPFLPVKNRRYTAGAFALDGGRTLYINRALGYLQRVRFNVRPEITQFRLCAV